MKDCDIYPESGPWKVKGHTAGLCMPPGRITHLDRVSKPHPEATPAAAWNTEQLSVVTHGHRLLSCLQVEQLPYKQDGPHAQGLGHLSLYSEYLLAPDPGGILSPFDLLNMAAPEPGFEHVESE